MTRDGWFALLWRLTIFALPWQTRWFFDARLGGWSWEQGRWSVPMSAILLLLTISMGWNVSVISACVSLRRRLVVFAGFVVATSVFSLSRTASVQWWGEVLVLGAFVTILRMRCVSYAQIRATVVMSVIPHACLALWQYGQGVVVASSWLGIAGHAVEALGSSVIEHGDVRVLRAYGGFPHPVILGGWLVAVTLIAIDRASVALTRWTALAWCALCGLFGMALVTTYARSAWIAGMLSLIALIVTFRGRMRASAATRQFVWFAVGTCLLFFGAAAYSQRAHVVARTDVSLRLERRSIDQRVDSLRAGWSTWLEHPWFGTGPNAELVARAVYCPHGNCAEPLEPPHLVPLLVLADFGVVWSLVACWLVWPFLRRVMCEDVPFFLPFLVIAAFDHYLFSTWSGLCLVALVLAACVPRRQTPEGCSMA